MAIEPQRLRRGWEKQGLGWRALPFAAVAVAAQLTPLGVWAQQAAATSTGGGAPREAWRFTPSIGIEETYSDNINLQPANAKTSDFVTTISPAFRLTRFGPRLTVNLDYNPQLLYYARSTNGVQFRNSLAATSDATLVENFLFFDALASVSQGNVSPFGTLAANSVNGSSNRTETRTYSLGPTLRSRAGNDLSYSAGYHFTGSTSNNNAYGANHTNVLYGQVESGTSYRNLGYGLDASRNDQTFGNAGKIVQETVGLTLTYVLTPNFHLRGRLGYDSNSYPTTGQPDLKGPSYSGGFGWQPSQHTQLNAQVGHRYFGPTANISLRETAKKFSISALYTRDQTTSSGSGLSLAVDPNYALIDQFYRATIPDPSLRAQAVVNALQQAGLSTSRFTVANFLSNQLFQQKTAQLGIALLGQRNTASLDYTRSESQSLSKIQSDFDVFDQAQKFRITTYSANWSHRLGPQTNANFTATQFRSVAILGVGDTRQRQFTASINRQFQRHLSGTLLYRNIEQTSNGQKDGANGSLGGNFYSGSYRENAILGSLRLTF